MTTASGGAGGTSRTGFSEQLHHLWRTRPLRLPRQSPVAGVASGFGRRYGVDPVLIRVAFVVSTIFGGAGIVLYLAAWLLLPAAGDPASPAEGLINRGTSSQSSTKTIVLIVALAIAVTTMGPVGVGLGGSGVISFALMVAGWWLLYMRQPEPPIDDMYPPAPEGGIAATGYPGASFPGGSPWSGTQPWSGSQYGPFTTLPDHYEPDPAASGGVSSATEPIVTRPDAAASDTDLNAEAGEHNTATTAESGTGGVSPATEPIATRPGTAASDTDANTEAGEHDTATGGASGTGAISADNTAGTSADATRAESTAAGHAADEGGWYDADDHPTVALTRPLAIGSEPEAIEATPETATDTTPDTTGYDHDGGTGGPATRTTPTSPGPSTSRRTPDPATFTPTPGGWDPLGVAPMAWDLPTTTPPQRPVAVLPAQRPRSRLTPVVIGLAVLAAAAAGALAAAGADWMTPARIGAVALAVVGLGLIVGAFLRRGYGLMVVLAPLAGFVVLAALVGPVEFDRGAMGEHVWTPASATDLASDYKITMGSGTLDLRQLPLTEDRTVHVRVQMGDFRVLVPESMRLHTTCSANMGDVTCPQGLTGPKDGPVLTLDVDVHAGNAEVKHG
ncbi:phage shock protein C (PspC) domain-containing protein [Nocardia nova SH22a]|uniref:Phage shock protein C (PspC) domain-containing protein n=1 Tax=Nocardia nova SH22a TaxID=1415166 RepID=W5TA13_9NOCA|nr:PspC domain-containing protein [Nocardia nova]AHH15838.1 phage shock protein C (PspC) domain-containing protein [Nocardia nova SH22a]